MWLLILLCYKCALRGSVQYAVYDRCINLSSYTSPYLLSSNCDIGRYLPSSNRFLRISEINNSKYSWNIGPPNNWINKCLISACIRPHNECWDLELNNSLLHIMWCSLINYLCGLLSQLAWNATWR